MMQYNELCTALFILLYKAASEQCYVLTPLSHTDRLLIILEQLTPRDCVQLPV